MIRLHHSPQTRSMRVLWLLYELGVDFERVDYAFDASLQTAGYRALHPLGRVPALELDGLVMVESGAMIEILCERFSCDGLGRSSDHPERPVWLQWVHFAETVSQHCAALTQQHVMLFEDHMRSPVIMKLEARRLEKALGLVNTALSGRDYLLDAFSAADIAVGQAVYMARYFVKLEPMADLLRWYDDLSARPAFRRSLPQTGGLYTQSFYAPWPSPK